MLHNLAWLTNLLHTRADLRSLLQHHFAPWDPVAFWDILEATWLHCATQPAPDTATLQQEADDFRAEHNGHRATWVLVATLAVLAHYLELNQVWDSLPNEAATIRTLFLSLMMQIRMQLHAVMSTLCEDLINRRSANLLWTLSRPRTPEADSLLARLLAFMRTQPPFLLQLQGIPDHTFHLPCPSGMTFRNAFYTLGVPPTILDQHALASFIPPQDRQQAQLTTYTLASDLSWARL